MFPEDNNRRISPLSRRKSRRNPTASFTAEKVPFRSSSLQSCHSTLVCAAGGDCNRRVTPGRYDPHGPSVSSKWQLIRRGIRMKGPRGGRPYGTVRSNTRSCGRRDPHRSFGRRFGRPSVAFSDDLVSPTSPPVVTNVSFFPLSGRRPRGKENGPHLPLVKCRRLSH